MRRGKHHRSAKDVHMTRHYGKFVSYLRVSTKRQGESGLGLEAQRKAVADYLNGGRWELIEEHVEVESGKDHKNRPALHAALTACRRWQATLVIAKLDRLSRDAHFLLGLQKAGVKFVAADLPEANEMVVGIMALMAQAERRMISERTKAALAAVKARGQRLGQRPGFVVPRRAVGGRHGAAATKARANEFANDLRPILDDLAHLSAIRRRGRTSSPTTYGPSSMIWRTFPPTPQRRL
jgi:DNA invertase Pin-like site-specific DNA recombinase